MAASRLVPIGEPLCFQNFAAMLRMGKKYMIPDYYNNAVQQLSKDLPLNLEDLDNTPNESLLKWDGVNTHPIDVANVARATGATVLLPALFSIFLIPPKLVIEGAKRITVPRLCCQWRIRLLSLKEGKLSSKQGCTSSLAGYAKALTPVPVRKHAR
jgi:hypothetical protein